MFVLRTNNIEIYPLKILSVQNNIVTHGVRYCLLSLFYSQEMGMWVWNWEKQFLSLVIGSFCFSHFCFSEVYNGLRCSADTLLSGALSPWSMLAVCLPKIICRHSQYQPRLISGLSTAIYGNPTGQSTAGSVTSPAFHGWSYCLQCEERSAWLKYKSYSNKFGLTSHRPWVLLWILCEGKINQIYKTKMGAASTENKC